MTIFTRRGGSIIFLGCIFIGIAISLAGYLGLELITDTFFSTLIDGSRNSAGEIDLSSSYPSNSNLDVDAFIQILITSFLEFVYKLLFNELYSVSYDVIYYCMILGVILIFSVITGYPVFAAGTTPNSVVIKRELAQEKAFAGEYILIEVKIKNKSINVIPVIEVYDAYPEVFELVLGENFITTQLNPKQVISFSYILRASIRGRFLIGPTKVIIHDRQGFYSNGAVYAKLSDLLVFPSYEDIKKLELLGSKRQLGKSYGIHKTRSSGAGTDFFGIREFRDGDPLKFVHWPSVAKTGDMSKLMVREFDSEENIKVLIVLDASASMDGGIPRNTKLEYSIRSCVLMAHLAKENKDTVGLAVINEEIRHFLNPTSSNTFLSEFLEILANIKAKGEARWEKLADDLLVRLKNSSYVIIISDLEGDHEEFKTFVRKFRSKKHTIFVISPFGPFFESRNYDLTAMDRMIGEVIQGGLVTKRKTLFSLLQAYEAVSLTVGPDDMLANVMQEFNRLKSS